MGFYNIPSSAAHFSLFSTCLIDCICHLISSGYKVRFLVFVKSSPSGWGWICALWQFPVGETGVCPGEWSWILWSLATGPWGFLEMVLAAGEWASSWYGWLQGPVNLKLVSACQPTVGGVRPSGTRWGAQDAPELMLACYWVWPGPRWSWF